MSDQSAMAALGQRLPDLFAFAIGVMLAGWLGWDTRALVWNLWLSSLVIGFASILLGIAASRRTARAVLQASRFQTPRASDIAARLADPISLALAAFLLAFFSVHFIGFHWGHSLFLNMFFPIDGSAPSRQGRVPGLGDYWQVVREGWWFVPLALVAERRNLFTPTSPGGARLDLRMITPYRNVVRLHLLIFVFAIASFVGVGGAWIFLLVYALYFLPWRGNDATAS